MRSLRIVLLAACLLLPGLMLGCSSKPAPMKDGALAKDREQATEQNTLNKFNRKKVLPPQPEGPPPPPLVGEGKTR